MEVRSEGNLDAETAEKRAIYLEAGALDVWICDEAGQMRFFTPTGERPGSEPVPTFPSRVEV
jgi:Uma2 family endonuclease